MARLAARRRLGLGLRFGLPLPPVVAVAVLVGDLWRRLRLVLGDADFAIGDHAVLADQRANAPLVPVELGHEALGDRHLGRQPALLEVIAPQGSPGGIVPRAIGVAGIAAE